MANRAHHWKPASNVKITSAVQRQMERERMSAKTISATPKVPRSGAYQFVIRILAANINKIIRTGPATATRTPTSSKDRPGCRAVGLCRSFMRTGSFHRVRIIQPHCLNRAVQASWLSLNLQSLLSVPRTSQARDDGWKLPEHLRPADSAPETSDRATARRRRSLIARRGAVFMVTSASVVGELLCDPPRFTTFEPPWAASW